MTAIITLEEAKNFLRRHWIKGCKCPACGQHVQLYDYKLYATSAFALIRLHRLGPGYHHVREYAEASQGRPRAPHFAELRFWGMIEPETANNDPKKKSSGFWRLTDKGEQFVKGQLTVQSRILVFNNSFQGFSDKSYQITIREALGNEFDYEALMNGQ